MKTTLDCLLCFVTHALQVSRMVTSDPVRQEKIIRKTLAMSAKMRIEESPPLMARKIHAFIRKITGVEDAYRRIKDESTVFALEMLPLLRLEVEKSADPFESAVRLAIAGNIIDFGADHNFNLSSVHKVIAESLSQPIDAKAVSSLKKAMDLSGKILYLADNCGEIVIDRLLIEPYREKITLAVRGRPILNDATRREAEMSGLDKIVRIVDTGDATPGIAMKYCGPEFKRAYRECELIVSKGQGNFETVGGTKKPAFFLLKAKCGVIASRLSTEIGSLQVIGRNL